jgi:kynurenine formamidase
MIALSRRTHTSVPFRGEFEYHMLGYFNRYIRRTTEYHFLSVHNMTHLETPISQFFSNDIKTDKYDRPRAIDAVVLHMDFPDICEEDYLAETIYAKYLKKNIYETEFWNVLSNLAITKEKIREKLRELFGKQRVTDKDLKDKFLLIATGWQKYYPKINEEIDYNLNNLYFECFHPWLIHPYLDYNSEALKYISEELQCGGLALESPSIDHPLSHVNEEHAFPPVSSVYRYAKKGGFSMKRKNQVDEIILRRLKKRKTPFYLIKNINFKELIGKKSGHIQIYPFRLLKDDWGIASEVFFVENQKKHEQKFIPDSLKNSRYLSRTFYEICSKRGFMRPEKLSLLEGDILDEHAPTIHFVPSHSTTHFDIYYDPHRDDWYKQYTRPISRKTIVVDLRDRIQKLRGYITSSKTPFGFSIPIIKKSVAEDPDAILQVLNELEVTRGELEERLDGTKTEGKFLIFNTGWDIFKPTRTNLNNRFWELHHAYLCHPYLSIEGAKYLAYEKKIAGIGTDAPLLENPVIYIDRNTGLKNPAFQNPLVIEKVLEDPKHKPYLKLLKSAGEVPCRSLFYKNNKDFLYLKNIRCMDDLFDDNNGNIRGIIAGRLVLCPLTSILPKRIEEMQCYSKEVEEEKQIVIGLPCGVMFYPGEQEV